MGVCVKKHSHHTPHTTRIHNLTVPPGPLLLHFPLYTCLSLSLHSRSHYRHCYPVLSVLLPIYLHHFPCGYSAFFASVRGPLPSVWEEFCQVLFVWKCLSCAFIFNGWFAGVEIPAGSRSPCALWRDLPLSFLWPPPTGSGPGPKPKLQIFLFWVFNGHCFSPQKQSVAIRQSQLALLLFPFLCTHRRLCITWFWPGLFVSGESGCCTGYWVVGEKTGSTESNLTGWSDHKFLAGQVMVFVTTQAYSILVKGLPLP